MLDGPAAVVDLGDIALGEAGKSSVTVSIAYLDPDADPEPGMIQVSLRPADGSGSIVTRVVGGAATFENLDPGRYQPEVDFSVYLRPGIAPIDLRDEHLVDFGEVYLAEAHILAGRYAKALALLHAGSTTPRPLRGHVARTSLIAARPPRVGDSTSACRAAEGSG